MRLYLYYAIHSTWNQIRKVFKTWIFLVVLASILGGGLFGLNLTKSLNIVSDGVSNSEIYKSLSEYFKFNIVRKESLIELVAGFMMLSIFSLHIITAEKSASQLFLPADVNFLFASDRSPQQNLMFRIMSTIGTMFVATIYMLIQLPGAIRNIGISNFAGFTLFMFWCISMVLSVLIKILIYELTCHRQNLRNNLRYFLFAFLGIIAISFYFFYKNSHDQTLWISMDKYFNATWTHQIPIYGWIKGMLYHALNNNITTSLLFMGLSIASVIVLWIIIKVMPTDYYEDAMIRSEEIALYVAENGGNSVLSSGIYRRQHFNKNLNRDGFNFGFGANVYLYKILYNRMRFSKLFIFSKASITYLIMAIISALFSNKFMDNPSIFGVIVIIAAFVFLHTVINPAANDRKQLSFILIPENTWLKLFWSTLGEIFNCLLDIIIPVLVGSYIAVGNPFTAIPYIPFILSIDLFAQTVNSFIDSAIPDSVDRTFKQVLQIIFLYVALIPDVLLIIWGLTRESGIGFMHASLLNLIIGCVFFGLTGVILTPVPGNIPHIKTKDNIEARKTFSKIGISLFIMYFIIAICQYTLPDLVNYIFPNNSVLYTIAYYLPIYMIGFPVAFILLKDMDWEVMEKRKLSKNQLIGLLPLCFFLMYGGSIIGLGMSFIGTLLPKFIPIPPVTQDFNFIIQILGTAIISPILEELLFRKILIDRTIQYGESVAVFSSALLFALFHANFNQFFYALFLGIVFGLCYTRTRNIKYTIITHLLINFMGSVIAPYFVQVVLDSISYDAFGESIFTMTDVPGVRIFLGYIILLFIVSLIGFVIFTYFMRSVRIKKSEISFINIFNNPGMIIFVFSILMIIFFR